MESSPMNPPPVIDKTWFERLDGCPERTSAGGVVARIERGNVLVSLVREIESTGQTLPGYVLPKGGIEAGEDRHLGAKREIEEEVGLNEVVWLAELETIERHNLTKSYWSINHYDLFITEQLEGEILDKDHHFGMAWFPIDDLPEMYWPDERDLIERHRARIYDLVIARQNPKARKQGFM
ncbi:MAG: NUDIX domain-containing protein [Candidatus Hydrogenedens sp.]|nr:NUDIX domain-containing protein [Candidatus Hydrogenedens sp.]